MHHGGDLMFGDTIGNLVKLVIIAIFSIISLIVTVYAILEQGNTLIIERYYLIPHLYIIPILLVSLWYPQRGTQVILLLIGSIVMLTALFFLMRHTLDPFLSLLNAGIDVWIVSALAMKARGREDKSQAGMSSSSAAADHQGVSEGGKDAIQGYTHALTLDDEGVREEAVRALGSLGDKRGVSILVNALRDESRRVREEAARSLGKIRDPAVIPSLIESLKDPQRNVREAAVQALAAYGEVAIDSLISTLTNQDWHVRMGAAIALRIIGNARAVDPLIQRLHDENRFVRREAVKSLGRLGDPRSQLTLMELLQDEDQTVRLRAEVALMKIHGRQHAPEDPDKYFDDIKTI